MDARLVAAAAAILLTLPAVGACARSAAAGRPVGGEGGDTIGSVTGPAIGPAPKDLALDSAPMFRDPPRAAPLPRYREWRVPAEWSLEDACGSWAAFSAPLGRDGMTGIVLLDETSGRRRIALRRPAGAAEGLDVTDVQVSDRWIAWEECSQYDIEAGAAARWRILAARVSSDGTLTQRVVVDQGVVGTRPRCTFRLVGSRIAVGATFVTRGLVPGVRGAPVIVDLETGARRVVRWLSSGILSLNWSPGLLVVETPEARDPLRSQVLLLEDATGTVRGSWRIPVGRSVLRRPSLGPGGIGLGTMHDAAAEMLTESFVVKGDGRVEWRTGYGGEDPVFVGSSVAYRLVRAAPRSGSGLTSSLVLARIGTGRQLVLATSDVATDGLWVLPLGAAWDRRHLWATLDRMGEPSASGKTEDLVRCYDVP